MEISVIRPPPRILNVYKKERITRSTILSFFKKKVYKYEVIK